MPEALEGGSLSINDLDDLTRYRCERIAAATGMPVAEVVSNLITDAFLQGNFRPAKARPDLKRVK